MKIQISLAIILLSSITINGQAIKNVLLDENTQRPVEAAHIYLMNTNKTGTISNRDGVFILKNVQPQDSLYISHLNYKSLKLAASEISNKTITMSPLTEDLNDVVITTESAKSILEKTIGNLEKNHEVEPALYQVYIRYQKYEEDRSQLHIFSEFVVNLYQTKSHNSKWNFLKTRAKAFSDKGKEEFESMRLIGPTYIYTNNLFKYKLDILKKRKLKDFDISFKEGDPGSPALKIECKSKDDGSRFVLHIDRETFGINRIAKFNTTRLLEEIGFKKIGLKYFLDYSQRFHKSFYNPTVVSRTEAIYNLIDLEHYDRKEFNGRGNTVQHLETYKGSWSDAFWEDYNHLAIPEWTKNLMENSSMQNRL